MALTPQRDRSDIASARRSNPVKIMRACRAFDFDGPQIAVAGSLAGDPRIHFGFRI